MLLHKVPLCRDCRLDSASGLTAGLFRPSSVPVHKQIK
jgi:hypothetical protein